MLASDMEQVFKHMVVPGTLFEEVDRLTRLEPVRVLPHLGGIRERAAHLGPPPVPHQAGEHHQHVPAGAGVRLAPPAARFLAYVRAHHAMEPKSVRDSSGRAPARRTAADVLP